LNQRVFIVVWSYLALGFVGLVILSVKRQRAKARELWTKYAWYVVVVHAVICSIMYRPHDAWLLLAGLVTIGGLYEIEKANRSGVGGDRRSLLVALPLYTVAAIGFLLFAVLVEPRQQLFVYVVVAVFDGFSQLVGQSVGKRKLVPKVSPGKTIEGLAGGATVALVTALSLSTEAGFSWRDGLLYGVGICFAALCGDLLASLYKRTQGVKDYGRLLPAHGGVLDRFDSFIMAGVFFILARAAVGDSFGVWRTVFYSVLSIGVLVLSEIIYVSGGMDVERTRKLSHFGGCAVFLIIPLLPVKHWQALVLCSIFTVFLLATRKLGMLKAIHAVDRRGSLGSYCFPVALLVCYLAFTVHGVRAWFYVPVLVMAVSDSMAALVGKRWPIGRYTILGDAKSLAGSSAFFVSAFCITLAAAFFVDAPTAHGWWIVHALIVAIGTTAAEALAVRGLDNLAVPLVALGLLYALS
jgi:phosphatidate cytidylyltransferase